MYTVSYYIQDKCSASHFHHKNKTMIALPLYQPVNFFRFIFSPGPAEKEEWENN